MWFEAIFAAYTTWEEEKVIAEAAAAEAAEQLSREMKHSVEREALRRKLMEQVCMISTRHSTDEFILQGFTKREVNEALRCGLL